MRKFFIWLGVVIIAAVAGFPFLMGAWVQHDYQKLIAFYNSQGNVHIDIVKYERSWYSASAELYVQLLHFPQAVTFTVIQHIQYGPVLPVTVAKGIFPLKLAAIQSDFQPTDATAKILIAENKNAPVLSTRDYITFTGRYLLHFQSDGFKLLSQVNKSQLQVGAIEGDLSLRPGVARVKGKGKFSDLTFANDQITITIPFLELKFDEHQTKSKLWIGKSSAEAKSITLEDVNGKTILLSKVQTIGQADESNGKINAKKNIKIDRIQLATIGIGPVSLKVSIENVKASPIADLFAAYKDMFYSKEKMIFGKKFVGVLPMLLTPQTTIKLEDLKIDTMDGGLTMTGQVQWPVVDAGSMQSLIDIFHAADAKVSMRISMSLANELLGLAADLSFIGKRLFSPQQSYFDMIDDVDLLKQQNLLMIGMLAQTNQIQKNIGAKLIGLQNTNVSSTDYATSLEEMQNSHAISRIAGKVLKTQYLKIQMAQMPPEQRMIFVEDQFADQFNRWIKDGYVREDEADYIISVAYKNGLITMNGKNY